MGRRDSDDDGRPPRPPQNPDVFDDEYALDPDEDDFMPSVSDGFRPAHADDPRHDRGLRAQSNRHDLQDDDEPSHGHFAPSKLVEGTDLRRMATRNSTAKGPDSVSQGGAHHRGPTSPASPLQHRISVSSTASFATMANSDGPFGTGPSHPYGMYPQHTMARSASIATTSTQRPQRPMSLEHPNGPSHPYGLYPQNVIEDEPAPAPVQTAIPVGFPGINTGFHRQIGPDGEEQDILGPFGHTEQLPPYSRYPEEGPTKASMAAEASAVPVQQERNSMASSNDALVTDATPTTPPSPVVPISPLAPIEPARLPQRRPETQTGAAVLPRPATTSESASLLASSEEIVTEKVEEEEEGSVKKADWRSKRLFGMIPMTVVLGLLALILLLAIVIGAVMGSLSRRNEVSEHDANKEDPKTEETPAAQVSGHTLFGATPISVPTSLPPLPTGQFSLPLGSAQESQPLCLIQGNQYSAWSCKMSFAPLQVIVNSTSDGYRASLQRWLAPDGSIQYGLQTPTVDSTPLQLVSDLDFRGYGPAWHFSSLYDKVVVLPPDEFSPGPFHKKARGESGPSFRHRFQVQPGDNPWYCIWNSTYIEGYLYVMDNSTAANMSNSPPSSTGYPPGPPPPPPSGPPPGSSTNATPTASATQVPDRRSTPRRDDATRFRFPYPYPRIIKVEERRLPNAPKPYCQKMQLLDNGQIAPASDSNGKYIIFNLQESDPKLEDFFVSSSPQSTDLPTTVSMQGRRAAGKRADPANACHCQWMFQ